MSRRNIPLFPLKFYFEAASIREREWIAVFIKFHQKPLTNNASSGSLNRNKNTLTKLNKIGNYQKTECKVSVQTKPSLESEAVAAINFWQASFFLWLTL